MTRNFVKADGSRLVMAVSQILHQKCKYKDRSLHHGIAVPHQLAG